MTSGGMLVRENVPWESRHVPQTVCWIPEVGSFAVATAPAAAAHNTLWGGSVVGDGTKGGVSWRTVLVALLDVNDRNRDIHRRVRNGHARGGFRLRIVV